MPCDLAYDFKTQEERIYLPGETYEINFYLEDGYFSDTRPDSDKFEFSNSRLSLATWLMCDIVKK